MSLNEEQPADQVNQAEPIKIGGTYQCKSCDEECDSAYIHDCPASLEKEATEAGNASKQNELTERSCWFWSHRWTKWHDIRVGRDDYNHTLIDQERRCLDCGKLQLRTEVAW